MTGAKRSIGGGGGGGGAGYGDFSDEDELSIQAWRPLDSGARA